LAAARIVQGALEAAKLPPAAARAVFRAMGAANAYPPGVPAPTLEDVAGNAMTPHAPPQQQPEPGIAMPDPEVQRAARRIEQHQEGLVLAMVRERMELDSIEMRDLEPGELQGFDYPPSVTAPGYREYELTGKPLVRFYSPEVAFEEGDMLVNMRYRVAV